MLTCFYSCRECGLVKAEVKVMARQSPNTDVRDYMEGVVFPAVGRDHRRRSPQCKAERLQDLYIPLPEKDSNAWIGKQT